MRKSASRRVFGPVSAVALAFTAACNGDGGTGGNGIGSVDVSPVSEVLFPGDTLTFRAVAFREDGTQVTNPDVEWSSSATGVAAVNPTTGRVTAGNIGNAAITARVGGRSDAATVIVRQDPFEDCDPQLIPIGTTVTGTLSTTDCVLDDDTFLDIYEFRVTTPRTVTITLQSSAFDAYLFLVDRVGENLFGEDNSSGGGTNARITRTLQPGRYAIFANAFDVDEAGPYTLTVN